jgi:hypothetical protein
VVVVAGTVVVVGVVGVVVVGATVVVVAETVVAGIVVVVAGSVVVVEAGWCRRLGGIVVVVVVDVEVVVELVVVGDVAGTFEYEGGAACSSGERSPVVTVTSVPMGSIGNTFAAFAIGISTQPALCGQP